MIYILKETKFDNLDTKGPHTIQMLMTFVGQNN